VNSYLLSKETWQEVFTVIEMNAKYEVFMETFMYLFDRAFPLQLAQRKRRQTNGWITQGIKISSKKIKYLHLLNKLPDLTLHTKTYISRYKLIYKSVIREAKRRENDHYVYNECKN
jgi:hypothetical protein